MADSSHSNGDRPVLEEEEDQVSSPVLDGQSHEDSQATVTAVDAAGVEQEHAGDAVDGNEQHHAVEQEDEDDDLTEEVDLNEAPPAIPSKDDEPPSAAETRSSMEDPAQFQDVELSESQQGQQQQRQQQQPAQVQQEHAPPTASSSTVSEVDVPPRPRSDTVSTANGSIAASQVGESPARPAPTPVRPSRASSTYSTRTASTSAAGRKPLLQGVLVVSAYETILNSKDARRTPALKEAAQRALDILKAPASQTSSVHTGEDRRREVFEPLRLACETKTNSIMITALDAIGKLVSYGFFNPPSMDSGSIQEEGDDTASSTAAGKASSSSYPENAGVPDEDTRKLSDLVVDTICDCFIEAPSGPAAAAIQAATSGSTSADAVNLQIVKAILTIVLQESNKGLSIHQSSLLKAVRTVYNIFLLSKSPTNQMVAQGALNQIVGSVFNRVRPDAKLAASAAESLSSPRPSMSRSHSRAGTVSNGVSTEHLPETNGSAEHLQSEEVVAEDAQTAEPSAENEARPSTDTLRPKVEEGEEEPTEAGENGTNAGQASSSPPTIEVASSANEADAAPQHGSQSARSTEGLGISRLSLMASREGLDGPKTPGLESQQPFFSLNELHTKDAYLVFRALCKLGMKPLGVESERDMKSHAMRSKLLSLHLILSILQSHMHLFNDPNVVIYSANAKEFQSLLQTVKQYLLLCLSRNAVSSVLSVFELSCEIFWRCIHGLRTKLKKEIEVLFNEIFLPILEMRNSSLRQKAVLLSVFGRLCLDPQALVEIYINYDCDRSSLDNLYERLVNIISRVSTTQFTTVTPAYHPKEGKEGKELDSNAASAASWTMVMPYLPPVPSTASTSTPEVSVPYFGQPLANSGHTIETQLKRQSLDCLVSILHSLVAWAGRPTTNGVIALPSTSSSSALHETGQDSPAGGSTSRNSEDEGDRSADLSRENFAANGSTPSLPAFETFDDPGRFETAKLRKTTLIEGIKKFNYKPKRGIQFLIEHGFIRSKQPRDVAQFLLSASDGLSKAMIGEYLGEADAENVATMHAFVDLMNFHDMPFTDALRTFLQSFRLPGEAQKIDRYMLKFAERYIACNPGVFADADTAYILAFATIMLNTDAHSPQIKKNRMTKAEFLKNNRGINNGQDLPDELLGNIYDEIVSNEIRMKDEVEGAPGTPQATGLAGALSYVGRDLQREAYVAQSEGMASKTEAMFRTMVKSQRRGTQKAAADVFFNASHVEHVRPMFEVVWMPLLAGISGPMQDSEDSQVIERSLDGFRQAIKIVCLFDLELERNAFVSTLHKYTLLNDFAAMRPKNVDAIRCLLEVAAINGNYLKSSWREVIVCVSQLERFQLIARGVDSGALPEIGRKHSVTSTRASAAKVKSGKPTEEVALETLSAHITNAADRIFSMSSTLSGTAIVDFVRALSEVSWEEIQSSGLAEHPRVFCLQKLVEIAYYNMNRIRLEWSHMWAILGDHFNQVCCHTNANVSFLALDSLRQLAMRFLEKQELQNFNFQKDFLKPFEYAMVHNNNPDARDMILSCMQQMIQARVHNLRSGWRTMFGVFCAASRVQTERVANQAFDIVKDLYRNQFSLIVVYGSFADLAVCITDFCKISKYQKISLHAIEMLRGLIPQMLQSPECPITENGPPPKSETDGVVDDPMTRFWFPVLFGFYDIIMNGEDLEVRKRALDYLFETLKAYGHSFPTEFWDSVCKEVLFPIFAVLRSRSDVSRLSTHEEMSVWFSTTMIQALRDLVDLFTYYFDVLLRMLDPLLALLVECICQENDTLARIGTSCLQQLLEKNVHKLTPELWEKIVTTFVQLFQTTTATQLFDENLRVPLDPDAPESPAEIAQANGNGFVHPTPLPDTSAPAANDPSRATKPLGFSERRRIFRQIIVKCVLQLLLIETAHDLLQNEEVYATIPPADLLRLMAELDHSYRFAKRFNADKDLRLALWKVGFMKQLPNLLKQESSSAATLVNVLLRMHSDTRPDHVAKRQETIDAFLPLGVDILEGYIALDAESQARNIAAWTPVVAEVLQGICSWDDAILQEHVAIIYPLAVDLMARDMTQEIRESVRSVFHRVGLALNIFQVAEGSLNGENEEGADEAMDSVEQEA